MRGLPRLPCTNATFKLILIGIRFWVMTIRQEQLYRLLKRSDKPANADGVKPYPSSVIERHLRKFLAPRCPDLFVGSRPNLPAFDGSTAVLRNDPLIRPEFRQ